MTGDQSQLMRLPLPSTEIDDVSLMHAGGVVLLSFEYGEEVTTVGELRFERARAYRHCAESHCSPWQVQAYDKLVEVTASPWVTELLNAMPLDMHDLFEVHHYMIYLDSFGCYEVAAGAWSFPSPRERGGPGDGHAGA